MTTPQEEQKIPLRVLLIDDDEDDYVITRELFSDIPEIEADLKWIATYAAGLDAVTGEQFDVCLVDYSLGEKTGLDLLQAATLRGCATPVIMLTGQGDDEIDVLAMKAGAADYLVKGHITPALLGRSIRYAVERAETLARLKDSESQYRLLFRSNPLPNLLYDVKTLRFLAVNDAAIRTYGYKREEFLNATVKLLHGDGADDSVLEYLTGDVPELGLIHERRHRRKDGTFLDIELTLHEITFASNRIRLAIAVDITDRKRMEESLRRSEAHFRSLTENALDLTSVVDTSAEINYMSPSSERVAGYAPEELLGRKLYDFVHADDKVVIENALARISTDSDIAESFVFRFRHADGGWRTIEAIGNMPAPDSGISGVVLNLRDASERYQLQQQLVQSEKLAALGKLVSGVAHELNNPLTSVLGYTQLLLTRKDIDTGVREKIEIVGREAERARRIVLNMLSFARQHKPTKTEVDLNALLDRTLELRAYEFSVSNIQVSRKLGTVGTVVGDSHLLQQVFMNILINAEQAMKSVGGGTLTVKTEDIAIDSNPWVRVTISDTGPGISPEVIANVFDPFFTTKDVGEGTGLGLSISYGIIKQHNGEIAVKSQPGEGAAFVIGLPTGSL